MPQYIILAGVNGSGKSTYYQSAFGYKQTDFVFINADNIERDFGGNWRSTSDNLKAMRMALENLYRAMSEGENIIQETTLAASKNGIQKLIERAKSKGYEIKLIYIGLQSADEAIARIAHRVEKGGHGVPTELVYQRYERSLQRLAQLEKNFDYIELWDNSDISSIELIYSRKKSQVTLNKTNNFSWVPNQFKVY